jgi:predicted RNA-binding protein
LIEKVKYLQNLLDENKGNQISSKNNNYNNNKSLLNISHNSFYIFGSGIEKEIKDKYKIDDNIEIQRILSKNKILELENSTLLYRIKCLEKKLSLNNNDINNNYEENDNDILDVDVYLENNIEEENYLNNQENDENNNFVGNNFMNYNKERYKFIYEDGKRQNDNNNNISINNPFLGIK